MRAEGQAHIDRIEAALALVRQSLDWDRALRRLEELDARVQDPTLWDDPKQAQAITQEQKRLETAINTVREIESEMRDAVEFVDMGEAEGDAEVEREGLDTLSRLAERAEPASGELLGEGERRGVKPVFAGGELGGAELLGPLIDPLDVGLELLDARRELGAARRQVGRLA